VAARNPTPPGPAQRLPTPSRTGPAADPGWDPADRDAYNRLKSLLDSFGLGSLSSKILGLVQEGMSDDSIMLELQATAEWRARFAANEARKAAGMSVLTPAEYLATERAYRQTLQEAGVPAGFYDQTSDFTKFLSSDISPAELKGRVDTAATFVRSADPQQLALMKTWYTEGDLIAFALDPKRAAPLVGKAFQAASIGGIGADNGLGIGKSMAEQLAAAGVEDQQARSGFSSLGRDKATLDRLSAIDGQTALTGDQLASAAFLGDAGTNKKIDRLKSAERGRFSGSSGIGQGSLSKSSSSV
jgi:hypothetical protein